MWRERYIKIFWLLFAFNLLVCLIQAGFAYSHWLKHEWWGLGISLFMTCFNGYFAWTQFNGAVRMKQQLKDHMWQTLSTPSNRLR